ncbi:chorismate synthase [Striga asiatica]|uniref:Chorismate synthase n=1 Tax=Striga asiatica TaxID=4170 RepID=A0A5A7R967_STRAF|nr:chorismate synthase [Striga asiatica]
MVQLMKNGGGSDSQTQKMAVVKMELEDSLEEEHGPLHKRPKMLILSDFVLLQQSLGMGVLSVPPSQYNPLDEPSPLGLRLRKSPSLLELIQMKLSQSTSPRAGNHSRKEASKASADKLKASNFPGSLLRIGAWEYKSRHEGDLVAKCYFAKHKLVWEVLDGGLKNKIEIQWSDIMALKANYGDDGPGTLNVVLSRQPLFFRETNPQPRKHTLWQATSDFTGGQASMLRQHYLECSQGLLGKHFEKLMQCDPRLNILSQQGEIIIDSPYFEPRISVFDDQNECKDSFDLNAEGSSSLFSLQDVNSPSVVQSSSPKNDIIDATGGHSGSYPRETPSPVSAINTPTVEQLNLKEVGKWEDMIVPGLRSSMSMRDLVSHLENRISEHPENPTLSSEDWQSLQILDDINRCLFSDSQIPPDEKSLMSRVNSLCCLLQKDNNNLNQPPSQNEGEVGPADMARKDSVGDLLMNLPRIASLPHFLFNISEDYETRGPE